MSVGTSKTKRVNANNDLSGFFELSHFGRNFNIPSIEIDFRIQRLYANSRGYHTMLDAMQSLNKPSNTGGSLEVTHITFH